MKRSKRPGDRRGTTMAEVIVAVAVTLLIMALFTQVVSVCLKAIPRAEALRQNVETAVGDYYMGSAPGAQTGGRLTLSDGGGGFTLDTALYQNSSGGTVIYSFENAD